MWSKKNLWCIVNCCCGLCKVHGIWHAYTTLLSSPISFGAKLFNNPSNPQSDMDRHLLLTCEHPFHFNVVSDIPFHGFTMKYTEPLELWISQQPFDVSFFWTKFNNHNKDEGNRSNFSLCFSLHRIPPYTPTETYWNAQKQILFLADAKLFPHPP